MNGAIGTIDPFVIRGTKVPLMNGTKGTFEPFFRPVGNGIMRLESLPERPFPSGTEERDL
jgi:hypothetical protein